MKICCEMLWWAVVHFDVEVYNHHEENMHHFYIYGEPRWDDDGDGHRDDATSSTRILYCPFCGAALKQYEEGIWLIDGNSKLDAKRE